MAQWQGARGWPSWSLSNHDVVRFASRLAGDDPQRTKTMLALLLCLRGTVFLYQGDELGLPHGEVPFERLRDPEAIAFWPAGIGRDGARTPMPWSRAAPMAGFTDAEDAWLPLDARHRALAFDIQNFDADSVLAFTREMIALRRASVALRQGDFIALNAPEPVLAFERRSEDHRVRCYFNLGAENLRAEFDTPLQRVLLKSGQVSFESGGATLGGYGVLLVEV
jgi:alpha-glucosidase